MKVIKTLLAVFMTISIGLLASCTTNQTTKDYDALFDEVLSEIHIPESTHQDIVLPKTSAKVTDAVLTWTSNYEAAITASGHVSPLDRDVYVTLTLTIQIDSAKYTKTYTVKVEKDTPQPELITISFNLDGGQPDYEPQMVEKGGYLTKPADPTKDDFIFLYWEKDGHEYDFNTPVVDPFELVAIWEPVVKTYTINFDLDGGTPTEPPQMIEEYGLVVKPADPTKVGYVFLYWAKDGQEYHFSDIVTSDFTLVAIWELDPSVITYVVTFNVDGGNETIPNQVIIENGLVVEPDRPTKDGYIFLEWEKDGEPYDFNSPVQDDFELVAIWEKELAETLAYEFDFSTLPDSNAYVSVDTPTTITNLVTNAEYVFTRIHANISTESKTGVKGLVTTIRQKNNYGSPVITFSELVPNLSKIEFSFQNWTTDAMYNLTTHLNRAVIQTSADGSVWTDAYDFTSQISSETSGVNNISFTLPSPETLCFRILIEAKTGITSTYQLRFIFTSMKVYNMA